MLSRFLKIVISLCLVWVSPTQTFSSVPSDTLQSEVALPTVLVRPDRLHYSKRNNPAVARMIKLRDANKELSPYNNDFYTYRNYERVVIGLSDVSDSIGGDGKFSFLKEFVDTSDVTGRRFLPISAKEKLSMHYFRKSPQSQKELIYALKNDGVDELFDQGNFQTMIEDVFREVDIFNNDITILGNRFVSPFSRIGPDFYKYFIGDTVTMSDGSAYATLEFTPHNQSTFGFIGRIYTLVGDSSLMVRRVDLHLPKSANVNFVESLQLSQQFEKAVNGARLKTSDILTLQLSAISGTQGLFAQRFSKSNGHDFSDPGRDELFSRRGEVYTTADAYLHDEDFWAKNRIGVPEGKHIKMDELMQQMRSVGIYRWSERILRAIITGYIPTGEPSKFDIGPINSLISFGDVEGTRFRVGGLTTAALNNQWFARGYIAYGTKDKKIKYNAEIEYSFTKKKNHSREFPINSIRASYHYDVYAPGQTYAFTNPDNVFLSLKREKDTLKIYERKATLEYNLELENHLSFNFTAFAERQESTRYLPMSLSDGTSYNHLNFSGLSASIRFAPGEKFYQTKSQRIPVNLDYPALSITHCLIPSGILGNRYSVNRTDIAFQKRFWFSAFGYADVLVKGSHVWSKSPFTQLIIPNTNLSYTIQPESFALLNPMEFILDSYANVNVTYWANGAIFNYLPLIKKLKLREIVSVNAFWGHLSSKNNPLKDQLLPQFPRSTQQISNSPYVELSVGIDNILKIFRVDYVWRLTYRNNPGIDRSGVRFGLHFTF